MVQHASTPPPASYPPTRPTGRFAQVPLLAVALATCALLSACDDDLHVDVAASLQPNGIDGEPTPTHAWHPIAESDAHVPDVALGNPTPCGDAGAPHIALGWRSLGDDGTAELDTTTTTITLTNRAEYPLFLGRVQVVGEFGADPIGVKVEAPDTVIPASGTMSIPVRLDSVVPEVEDKMTQSASVAVFAQVLDIDGHIVEQAASPALFFHRDADGLHIYDRDVLEARHAFGALEDDVRLEAEQGQAQRIIAVNGIPPEVEEGL